MTAPDDLVTHFLDGGSVVVDGQKYTIYDVCAWDRIMTPGDEADLLTMGTDDLLWLQFRLRTRAQENVRNWLETQCPSVIVQWQTQQEESLAEEPE